jgi:hypothetical protein
VLAAHLETWLADVVAAEQRSSDACSCECLEAQSRRWSEHCGLPLQHRLFEAGGLEPSSLSNLLRMPLYVGLKIPSCALCCPCRAWKYALALLCHFATVSRTFSHTRHVTDASCKTNPISARQRTCFETLCWTGVFRTGRAGLDGVCLCINLRLEHRLDEW